MISRSWLLAAISLAQIPAAAAQSLVVCDDVREPVTLDPYKIFSEKSYTIVQQMLEGLVRFSQDGTIEPALAMEWRRLDPRTMQFSLRPGVVFHDGSAFDASSVRYSFRRYLDPKTGFPGRGFVDSIDRVDIVDPLTVNIVTKYPDGLLLNRLSFFLPIVPKGSFDGDEGARFSQRPVGTGPFRFERWNKGESIVFSANTSYWAPGRPRVKTLEFRFIREDEQLSRLLNGEIDLVTSLPGTQTMEVRRNPDFLLMKKPIYYTIGISPRTSSGPLADKRVRQAMNYALNKTDLIRYDLRGNGLALAALSIPGSFGHDPNLKPYPYDPARAKRLLEEAGFGDGITLKTIMEMNVERTGKVIAAQLEKAGIKLDITWAPDALTMEYIRKKQFDLVVGSAPNPILHPFFTQAIVLYSKSPYSLVRDRKYDAMLENMAQTLDPDEQAKLCRELERYVHEEALSLFTYQRIQTAAMRRGLHFQPYMSGMPYFHSVSWAMEGMP